MVAVTHGVVQRPKPGQLVCGDAWLALADGDRYLFVVADGLGSGHKAREASQLAVDTIAESPQVGVGALLQRCDEAIRGTRGAAMAILAVVPNEGQIEYAGVGNIELRSGGNSAVKPVTVNGIVGSNFREPRVYRCPYQSGEWLVMYSDGLRSGFDLDLELQRGFATEQALAEHLAAKHGRDEDDLTVLVVRTP